MEGEVRSEAEIRRDEAERVARRAVRDEMSKDFEYSASVDENDEAYVVTILPKARVRGGGFEVTVSKSDLKVVDVVHMQ